MISNTNQKTISDKIDILQPKSRVNKNLVHSSEVTNTPGQNTDMKQYILTNRGSRINSIMGNS